jgi:hypothetical protein
LLTPEPKDRLQSLEGFPMPVAEPKPPPSSLHRRNWLPWVGAGAVGLALAAAAYVLLNEPPPPAPTPATPKPASAPAAAAPPPLDRARIERDLQTVLTSVPCTAPSAVLGEDGVVRLSGTLPSEGARNEVLARLAAVPGVARVEPAATELRPMPHCEAAEEIARLVGAPGLPPPVIALSRPDGIYAASRDVFEARLSLPGGPAAHLYLDYFHENGEVYHLLPEELAPDNALPPGGVLRVGRSAEEAGPRERVWRLSEPFGAGRVVAIASGRPLYDGIRPIGEQAADYLAFLAATLPAARADGLSTAAMPIETRP